jgi:hypothetical protein
MNSESCEWQFVPLIHSAPTQETTLDSLTDTIDQGRFPVSEDGGGGEMIEERGVAPHLAEPASRRSAVFAP